MPSAKLDGIELLEVLRQKFIDTFSSVERGFVIAGAVWYIAVEVLRRDEFQNATDKVAEILEEYVVVRTDECVPLELRVAGLWSMRE